MKLEIRRTNFSQFSDDVWLTAENDGTKMDFDVDECDLVSFAEMLIDVALDCIYKSKCDTEAVEDKLREVLEELEK